MTETKPATGEMNKTMEAQVCRNDTEQWVNQYVEPRKTVDHVEDFVIVAAVFMIILAILSPRRRQSRSIIIRYGVEGVFILSFPLLSYTVGLMHAGQIKNELYPVWAMFLAMLFGGTNAMSVQSLDQNKQLIKLRCDCISFLGYLGIILGGLYYTFSKWVVPAIVFNFVVSFPLSYKVLGQLLAAVLASKPSSDNGIKWLADYMKREHQLSTFHNPCTMQGYKYAVLIHLPRQITLDEIWCGNIGVLSSSDIPGIGRLKDICLSFSLFHLVVRRYFGYSCPESKLDKSRDLVLDELLRTEQDNERAFQVIEAELAFLYDFFFTKYAYIMYGREVFHCAVSLAITVLCIGMGIWTISASNKQVSILDDRLIEMSTRDIVVTIAALGALSVSELLQIWSYCASDWAKVSLVCKYATHPSWQGNTRIEKVLLLLGRPHRWLRYWRNTIGQYSVLDSFSSSCWDRLKQRFQSRKAGKPIELPMEVKKAVARIIKNSNDGHLSNGVSALMRHGMSDELCLLDDEFTLIHSILVWHVGTSYCEISEFVRHPDENVVQLNQVVATSLSKYCAYLIAFCPKLLPGSPMDTECTLDELVQEAKETLQDLVSPRQKYKKLIELHNTARERRTAQLSTFIQGVMLGNALESLQNPKTRWDLLADFWAEMLVYIAPSNNVAGHIELLAQGGEFVTHVWALLMHAGILEQPAAATAVP